MQNPNKHQQTRSLALCERLTRSRGEYKAYYPTSQLRYGYRSNRTMEYIFPTHARWSRIKQQGGAGAISTPSTLECIGCREQIQTQKVVK
jgi:hypothetical protein